MNEFLHFVDKLKDHLPCHVEITYSKCCDWMIRVYRKGVDIKGRDIELCNVQDCDMELAFAKAQVELKEWLSENQGGF